MTHYHAVHRPGQDPTNLPCYLDSEIPCRYSAATPEELGDWLACETPKHPFWAWLRTRRMLPAVPSESGMLVDPSIADLLRKSIENPKRSRTVPVTMESGDGKKWVVGEAEVEVLDNGDVVTTAKLNPDALRNHISIRDLGPFSISTVGSPPAPAKILGSNAITIRHLPSGYGQPCEDADCQHYDIHNHGPACTSSCACNRYGRAD